MLQIHADIFLVAPSAAKGFRLLRGKQPIAKANAFLRSLDLRGLSFHTIRAYGYDLVNLYRWLKRTKRSLETLEENDLYEYIAHQKDRNASALSINRRILVCELFYRFCFKRSLRRESIHPQSGPSYLGRYDTLGLRFYRQKRLGPMPRVKVPDFLPEPLDTKEASIFLRTAKRYRDQSILLLMLNGGLRSSEILNLQLHAVNLDERSLMTKGKGKKERVVPLSDEVVGVLRKYLRFERPLRSALTFFTVLQGRRRGLPMTPAGLRTLFRYRRLQTNIQKAHPHRMRHTFGANMAKAGMQLPVLQALMGHSHPQTTLRYIRLHPSDIAESYHRAIQKIEAEHSIEKE